MRRGSDVHRQIESLLRENGAVRQSSKKHQRWRFPSGDIWIVPRSPKFDGGFYYNLRDLQRFLRTGHSARAPHRDLLLRRQEEQSSSAA